MSGAVPELSRTELEALQLSRLRITRSLGKAKRIEDRREKR